MADHLTMQQLDSVQKLTNNVSILSWSSISSSQSIGEGISTSVMSILNTIGQEEAKFADVQGVTYNGLDDASVIIHYGYGDCWADSSWLYNQLTAAGTKLESWVMPTRLPVQFGIDMLGYK